MNTAHWHLLLNHFPIIGIVIGTMILVSGFLLRNHPVIKRVSLGIFVASAFVAIPAFLTGEGAEELVEKMPGVTEGGIEEHEDLGKLFLVVVSILGILSLITFFIDRKMNSGSSIAYTILLLVSIGACVLAKQIGTTGGEIRHTEIRSGNGLQPAAEQQNENAQKGKGDDD